jgi:hypothetical protein
MCNVNVSISVEHSGWDFRKLWSEHMEIVEKDSDEPASFEAWVPGYMYLEIRDWDFF